MSYIIPQPQFYACLSYAEPASIHPSIHPSIHSPCPQGQATLQHTLPTNTEHASPTAQAVPCRTQRVTTGVRIKALCLRVTTGCEGHHRRAHQRIAAHRGSP